VTRPAGPIGVFDSGVGGLTVVQALLRRFPNEQILYVADQAHVPYGGRPLNEVCCFASGISAFLAARGCRAVVMACNISSATALPYVCEALAPLPVLGVISPAANRAARDSESPCIGVLATEGTVRTGAYTAQIRSANPMVRVTEVPCPKFVPLVESGSLDTETAREAAAEYLMPLAEAGCKTVILGCTHYPFLLPTLRRVAACLFPSPVTFIDPADEMAAALCRAVPDVGLSHVPSRSLLLTTGNADNFRDQAPRFLTGAAYTVGEARWNKDGLLDVVQAAEAA
jgi:glutamate racemase